MKRIIVILTFILISFNAFSQKELTKREILIEVTNNVFKNNKNDLKTIIDSVYNYPNLNNYKIRSGAVQLDSIKSYMFYLKIIVGSTVYHITYDSERKVIRFISSLRLYNVHVIKEYNF